MSDLSVTELNKPHFSTSLQGLITGIEEEMDRMYCGEQ